jgi:hypothetical protein
MASCLARPFASPNSRRILRESGAGREYQAYENHTTQVHDNLPQTFKRHKISFPIAALVLLVPMSHDRTD